MRKNSIKNTRINREVQQELSNIIRARTQGSESGTDDFGCDGRSGTGSEDL